MEHAHRAAARLPRTLRGLARERGPRDPVVVGGGLLGLEAAWGLARRGLRVRLSTTDPAAHLADAQMRELYDAYVTAKRRCNEDTTNLTFDAVAKSVSKQIPEIMKQHNARSVEFKVVIKDGKAVTYDAADRIARYTHLSAATGQATPATQAG